MSVLKRLLPGFSNGKYRVESAGGTITPDVLDHTEAHNWNLILKENPWVTEQELVAKPDQLIKR